LAFRVRRSALGIFELLNSFPPVADPLRSPIVLVLVLGFSETRVGRRSPFTVHRSPFTVHVHRSPFTVQAVAVRTSVTLMGQDIGNTVTVLVHVSILSSSNCIGRRIGAQTYP
jgi:hypothetical protein